MVDTVIHWVIEQFQTNAVFSGLTGASLIASATYLLRSVPKTIFELLHSQCVSYFYVTNDDYAFNCINCWLAQQDFTKRSRRMNLMINNKEDDRQWVLAPGAGRHYFFFNRRLFWVDRVVSSDKVSSRTLKRQETLTISTLGRRRAVFDKIISLADQSDRRVEGVEIYGWRSGWWSRQARRDKRPLSTVILPERQKVGTINDLLWFMNAHGWYAERGIPYHRGYLLSGPPGTGKTSLIFALASHFDRPIYLLNLGMVGNDDQLLEAFSEVPADAFLLIEDIDACYSSHTRVEENDPSKADSEHSKKVSLSGLLNVIDGVATAEGRIYFMTSNYPDRLDSALLRPGRVDVHEVLKEAEQTEVVQMFERFYPNHAHLAGRFAVTVSGMSPAELQSLFMRHPNNPITLLNDTMKIAS